MPLEHSSFLSRKSLLSRARRWQRPSGQGATCGRAGLQLVGVLCRSPCGGGRGHQSWSTAGNTTAWGDFAPGQGFSQSANGVLGGGQLGCNQQFGQWVVGIEGALSGSDLKGDYQSVVGTADDFFATKITAFAIGAARLGYARDNWLLYGKGGYAVARVKVNVVDVVGPRVGSGESTDWNNGWTVGAGLEYGVTPHLVLGVEYDYLRLGTRNTNLASPPAVYGWDVSTHIHAVLGRVSYKFGPAALMARY